MTSGPDPLTPSAPIAGKTRGGRRGVLVFEGGVIAPPCRGVGSAPPPPASLPAAIGLNDLRIVPSGIDQAQFPCPFPAKRGASCAVLIDCKTSDVDEAARYWGEALGCPVDLKHSGSRGNYRLLETRHDEPIG